MTSVPSFLATASWENRDLYLFHGSLDVYAKSIRKRVLVERGSPLSDFGMGFYTTTVKRQARAWAWQLAIDYNATKAMTASDARPVVISFQVDRDDLSKLQGLHFVRGDFFAEDYWSLVHHCRSGGVGHRRHTCPESGEWYDLVVGPVAAVWRTRLAIANSDQFSFHTQSGANLLDGSPKRVERVKLR